MKFGIKILVAICAVALAACSDKLSLPEGVAKITPISSQEKIAQKFIEAFSANDADAMASYCGDDFKWGYVREGGIELAGQGREDLVKQMKTYFAANLGVRSDIENVFVNGDFVALSERVFWSENGAEKTASSLAVYHIEDNAINSVWYYPAQP